MYVILLHNPARAQPWGLYVGQTSCDPDWRFDQHKLGYKASGAVKRFGVRMLPELTRHPNPMQGWEALDLEAALADALRAAGVPSVKVSIDGVADPHRTRIGLGMTAADLLDLLTKTLVKTHGRSQRSWRAALGPIKVHDRRTHPHCNWSIAPSGSSAETAAIEDLLDDVRLCHPLVMAD